jgi:hypothetical protein
MKSTLALLMLVAAVALDRPALAQEPAEEEPPGTPAPKTVKAPEPPVVPDPPKAPEAKTGPSVEIYVTALPFLEGIEVTGVTKRDFVAAPSHIGTASVSYNGVNGPLRARMSAGTSHIGFRGALPLAPQLKVIAQLETAFAVDGDPNPWEADFPNRNSYLGLTGNWGTLAFGMLDTPYKWLTLSTLNPIKAGYVADYTPIIGSPGFLVTAINPVQRWSGSGVSNTSFDRREANSIQYWSPTIAGLYLRASYTINEFRTSGEFDSTGMMLSPETNPYMVSIGGGFDFAGLRLRYAWENHHDYFGLGYISGVEAPGVEFRTSNDWGNRAVVEYTLTITPDVKTRVAVTGEYLKYTLHAEPGYPVVPGKLSSYSRPAVYGLLEQTISRHHVWGAYGRAFSGECTRFANADGTVAPCSTSYIGAHYVMAGYMFAFSETAQAFLMGYRLMNERSGLYVTAPALAREGLSPGYDQTGVGIGFYYAFGAELLK